MATIAVGLAGLTAVANGAEIAATASSGGGARAPEAPVIKDAICKTGCVGFRKGTRGGTIQVSGSGLERVTEVSFPIEGDRVLAPVTATSRTTAEAVVPAEAVTGRLRVRDGFGNTSNLSPNPLEVRPASELQSGGILRLLEAVSVPRKAYYDGMTRPTLTYMIGSDRPSNDLRIDVVADSGEIVRSFFRDAVAPNATNVVRWDGKDATGKAARGGRYFFRIGTPSGAIARRGSGVQSLGFKIYGFIFPVRAPHEYGDGIGAPRAGHTHQGLDIFAACGARLVAARGGVVQYRGYQAGGAGYYVVIDGKGTGIDFAYMHLTGPALVGTGERVHTGQKIGTVGETGNASGCHLHYEMWGPPGWYEGGTFLDPTPYMKRWDRWS